jgi:hypothetical protein
VTSASQAPVRCSTSSLAFDFSRQPPPYSVMNTGFFQRATPETRQPSPGSNMVSHISPKKVSALV